MAETRPERLAIWSQNPTSTGAIASALDRLWVEAAVALQGSDGAAGASPGIMRVGVINLLAYASSSELCDRAHDAVIGLAGVHPGRSILVQPQPEADPAGFGAVLSAYRQGGARACYDEVRLLARGSACAYLDGVAEQLFRRELPVLVWWLAEPDVDDPAFQGFCAIADTLIVDSAGLQAPLRRLQELVRFDADGQGRPVIADLNWNRLLEWREVTAQFFDAQASRALLEDLRDVEIVYAGNEAEEPPVQPLLLAGWLASSLGWKPEAARRDRGLTHVNLRHDGRQVELRLRPAEVALPAGSVTGVRLDAGGGPSAHRFGVRCGPRGRHGTATMVVDGVRRIARGFHFEQRSDSGLLAEEIEARGVDCALGRARASAAAIAALLSERSL